MIWIPVALLSAWTFAAFIFTMGALTSTRRMLRRIKQRPLPSSWPSLAILRPCAGLEPGLEENLLSTVVANYGGEKEIFLLVASVDDTAYPVLCAVEERARAIPHAARVHVVVTDISTDHNRKVAQLAHVESMSNAEVIVVIDSDLRLDDENLPSLMTALSSDSRAGAASCAPIDVRRDSFGDRASAAVLTSTPHAFYCLASLAERSGGAHVLCGAFIAIRRSVLQELGGFRSLEPFLGEDFELARRLHAAGYTIPIALTPGRVTDHLRSVGSVLRRFVRWAMVTRQQRAHLMVTYILFLACGPVLIASVLAALAVNLQLWPLGMAVAVVLLLRLLLSMMLRRACGLSAQPHRAWFAMLLGELVILMSVLGALGPPIVAWRGHRLYVRKGGLIERV